MRHLGGIMLCCVAVACSGGGKNNPGTEGSGSEQDKQALCERAMTATMDAHEESWNAVVARGAPSTLDEMAEAACERFCGRQAECSIEDACENLDAMKLAELDLEKTGPESIRRCVSECNTWSMTREQVQTLGNCSQDDQATCATFRDCTAAAQP